MRAAFPSELRQQLNALLSRPSRRPLLRALGQRGWAALAAVVVIGAASSVALFANRPQPVSAALLDQVQAEAIAASTSAMDLAACAPASGTMPSGAIAIGAIGAGSPPDGPVVHEQQPEGASQLSDRLAQALGVSGDRIRQAMLQTISADLPPSPPPDPIAAIAQQLGVSSQQVCAAFFNNNPQARPEARPQARGQSVKVSGTVGADRPGIHTQVLNLNGTEIDLNNVNASQLSAPAEKLGVSPERLSAALRAALPAPPPVPPTPPNKDEIISRFAHNLGMSEERVRAAITQVEGPNQFYFVVPLRGPGK
jgi:hypothetical protein